MIYSSSSLCVGTEGMDCLNYCKTQILLCLVGDLVLHTILNKPPQHFSMTIFKP